MSYTVTLTSGLTLATVADGTVNNTASSLTLIGKNYAGYGIFLNENFVELLENFANTTAPGTPLTGQLWFDSTNTLLKVWTGNIWKPIHTSSASSTSPPSPITGDLWWDTINAQLKVYSGSIWVTVGPSYTTTSGTSGAIVQTLLDTPGNSPHVAVMFYISNTVMAILSKDTYTSATVIPGFSTILPGMNLISSGTLPNSQFHGDTANALALGGITAANYLRADIAAASAQSLTVATGLFAATNNAIDIGTSGVRFANMWATTFCGTAIQAEYADLAERFETDAPLLPGTVVELGGLKEITTAIQELSEAVFGVISTNAGFLMNGAAGSDVTHPPVAVNGRVPVRVIGIVAKGDRLVSAGRGLARAATRSEMTAFNVIGRALENKTSIGEGTVEAIVKLNS